MARYWATALMVLGPDKGYELATARDIAATFVVRAPTGLSERSTRRFDAYHKH